MYKEIDKNGIDKCIIMTETEYNRIHKDYRGIYSDYQGHFPHLKGRKTYMTMFNNKTTVLIEGQGLLVCKENTVGLIVDMIKMALRENGGQVIKIR